MKTSLMKAISIVFVFMLVLSLTGLVLADDVANNADTSVDSAYESVSLIKDGPAVTVDLYTVNRNGDGKQGCNLTGSTTLVVSVISTNPNIATVAPSQVTFTSCEPVNSNSSTAVTVFPISAGSTDIEFSLISNNSGGSFNLDTARFTVTVTSPNAAPVVTVTGVTNNAAYEIGSVPAAGCSVTDDHDVNPSASPVITGTLTHGLGTQTVTCSYTDGGGLTGSASATYTIVDTGKPEIAFFSRTPANIAGWNNTDVTVTWNCSDSGSGVVSATVSTTITTEGANQSAIGTCTDNAGNTASDTQTGINIDKTAPVITDLHPTTSPNANGWYKTAVVNQFRASDNLSGFAGATNPYDFSISSGTAEGTAVIVNSGTVTDLAGNVSASLDSTAFKIDLTAPTLTWENDNLTGQTIYFGFVPAAPTCTAADLLSGPDGCNVSGYDTTVGTHTLTATANDVAGNQTIKTRSYTVLAWTLYGFYQPVDMNGVYNVVKNGSTVPLKFEVFAGPTELTDTASVENLTFAETSCSAAATTDDIETTATGGTALRYDLSGGQFVYNWKTPATAGKCYRVTMTTQDGSSLVAYFKLK